MREKLEEFLGRIPNYEHIVARHTKLVPYFGYFLSEVLGEPAVRPARIKDCYETAAIPCPGNVSDVMRRSGAFVRTAAGLQLHRDVKARIGVSLSKGSEQIVTPGAISRTQLLEADAKKNVLVVYGRDEKMREALFQFLRCLGLTPIEWNRAVSLTSRGSPYVGEILDRMFESAQAVVVLLTPDERAELRDELRQEGAESTGDAGWQPRPNVLIEAGMALAKYEPRTILVQVGEIRRITDLEGRHIVHLDNSADKRNSLAQRLKTAGCDVDTIGTDWLKIGNFEVSSDSLPSRRRKSSARNRKKR